MEKDKKKIEDVSAEKEDAEEVDRADDRDEPTKEASSEAEAKPEKDDETEKKEEDRQDQDDEKAEKAESEEESSEDKDKTEDKDYDKMKEQYVRLMAEFQNYKRRTKKEREDIYQYANEKLMVDLLGVVDNFERALKQGSEDKQFLEGMGMIFNQFFDVLKASGLEEVKALGEDFDPNKHHAVMMEENPDCESGKVSEVIQKGYKLNEKVIRPSMVKVSK